MSMTHLEASRARCGVLVLVSCLHVFFRVFTFFPCLHVFSCLHISFRGMLMQVCIFFFVVIAMWTAIFHSSIGSKLGLMGIG